MTWIGRRYFLVAAALACTGVARWRIAFAREKAVRIGVLSTSRRPDSGRGHFGILFDELAKAGWVEGRNLNIAWRYANGVLEHHDALAAELVGLRPDIIITGTQPGAVAALKATATIPVVFVQAPDPVGAGLAYSLSRPGKNVTGLASVNNELVVKRLEFMREAFGTSRRIAVMYDPSVDVNLQQLALVERAAQRLALELLPVRIGLKATFDAAFAELGKTPAEAVLVFENPSTYTHRQEVVKRISNLKLLAMYGLQDFVLSGGLMSYSISFTDQFRRTAGYVDRILRGARPGELPIELPVRLELTVNLTTAKALGFKVPQSILLRADRVIE
jgi:putative ABC transport system substrate-binding protein